MAFQQEVRVCLPCACSDHPVVWICQGLKSGVAVPVAAVPVASVPAALTALPVVVNAVHVCVYEDSQALLDPVQAWRVQGHPACTWRVTTGMSRTHMHMHMHMHKHMHSLPAYLLRVLF